jgi:hypothetical protein
MTDVAQSLLWLLLPCAIGYCAVDLCALKAPSCPQSLRFCLGFGVGIGATSCAMFVSTLFFGARSLWFLAIDVTMLALLLVLRSFKSNSTQGDLDGSTRPLPYRRVTLLLLFASAELFVITAFVRGVTLPHGVWDAWTIWNFRARWIFRASEWTSAFNSLFPNTDYPLLLPSTVLQGWNLLGRESTLIPIFIGISFELVAVALLI